MSAPSLLIEIGCEELPARFMQPLAQALHDGITQGLDKAVVSRGSSQSYATPRRVAVLIQEVATEQPEQAVERLGPALSAALRDGAPSPAGLGFAKSCGVDFADLEQVQTPKGEYLMFRSRSPGQAALLQTIFADTIKQMDKLVPKRMRWGAGEEAFVRPVHWICALHGSQALALQGWGLSSAQHSYGHRFHAPDAIKLPQADTYVEALRQAKVWADVDSRRAEIARQVEAAGQARGGQARMDADLLGEVTALVEWPVAISGGFEERFLDVPAEAIVLTIQDNQRYFPVFDPEQRLLPCFVTVANIDSADATQVVAGNERVVRPRLEDALFFWQQDLKTPLAQRLDDLARVTWAQGLGSLKDKAQRLQALCAALAPEFGLNADAAGQAGLLAKCDLTTKMVFEMPELQGIMGGHYLRAEDPQAGDIADAVAEQYRPAGPSERIPSTALGQLLSLADKLDTLCGYFSIGAIPTASKDPFGLRRAALGLLRILLEGG
ncbi:MAG: glycine--tRNA ligase subunit beta, partial [Oceanococcaceae bacterium]